MTVLRALLACLLLLLPQPGRAQQEGGPPGTYFPVAILNEGLGPRPPWMDLSTPQSAIASFLDAAGDGDADAAAHVLNLADLPPAEQAAHGPRLAMELATVLNRRAVISWRQLLERPDALDARQSSSVAMAGEPRRSILIGVLDQGAREAAIRLNRVRPENGDPVWVFSERTVAQVPALYERYGPTAVERVLPAWLTQQSVFGFTPWTLLGLPTILVFAWAAGWISWRIFHALSARSDPGSRTRVVVDALRWPSIIVATTTVILLLSLYVFAVSGPVASVLTPTILVGYVIAVLLFGMSALDTALNRIVTMDSARLADPDNSTVRNQATLMTAARRALIVIGVLVGLGIVMASANLFRTLGFSLLASAGAVTLVIGFAARHVLGNILASLQISINRSARIGDRIVFEGDFATVERIHFTYIQLKTMKDNRLIVPVSIFVNDKFENWSMEDGGMTCHVPIVFAPTADLEAMHERFLALVEEEPLIPDKDTATLWVMSQDAVGITVRFQFRVENPTETWTTERRMQERVLKAAQDLEAESGRIVLPRATVDAAG